MKFGCFSLDYRRFSLETAFAQAASFGFEGIEIWGGRPHAYPWDMDEAGIGKILQLKEKYHLEVPMYTPNAIGMPVNLCSMDDREQKDALDYFMQAVRACRGIGSPRMLLVADHPGYETPRRTAWKRFIDNMKELAAYAKEQGVILVIESLTPMESPVITTADDCACAIEDIGADNVEAMLDIVPPTIAYEPLSNYFDRLKGKLHYVHLCNNDRQTDAHLRLDTGELAVEDMVRVLHRNGFDGYVTVELYSECYSDPQVLLCNASRILEPLRRELS